MDNQLSSKLQLNKAVIIKVAIIFIVAYGFFLGIWLILPIEDYYGLFITKIASYFVSVVKGVDVVEIVRNADIVSVDFLANNMRATKVLRATIEVPTGNYAFNVPLTLAIMAAFYPFIKSKWLYLEALIILIFVHLLFVFFLEGQKITAALAQQGFQATGSTTKIFWEFLWGFIDNMVVRFEPFLIGAYLFLMRNRVRTKKVSPERVEKAKVQRQAPKKKKPKRKR